ncbi:MAG: serine/threonine-protein kinase [Gemmatimonadota bacterium]
MSEPNEPISLAAVQTVLAGAWSLERILGTGGMGTVFLARDVALDRPVAIKVLHPALAALPEQRARFLREARTGARLAHPHIVPIFAVEERSDLVYFVMGLVDGESVGARVAREGPIAPAESERMLREVGWALGYAHAMGVVHRDVTLENMLIERSTGRVLLADFGIAAEINRPDDGPLLGTPRYLAPELIRGEVAGASSDLYALGVSAWTLLAGRFPFDGVESADILLQHLTAPTPSLASAAPATPPRMVRSIERCLAKMPEERPATVEEFLALLERPGQRVALAAPLQRWVTRGNRIRPAWAFGTTLVGMLAVNDFADAMTALSVSALLGAMVRNTLLVVVPMLLLQGVFEWRELRLALRAGYGIEDLRLAWRQHCGTRTASPAPLLGRAMHDLAVLSLGAIVVIIQAIRYGPILVGDWTLYAPFVASMVEVARWCWMLLWTGLGAAFVVRMTPTRPATQLGLTDRLWQSPMGRLAARAARWGMSRPTAPETTLHRPTELVLDLAIEELWEALPAGTRVTLDDLPTLARALRRRVAELKAVRNQLAVRGLSHSPETAPWTDRLGERERAAIAALEGLRLSLARLTLDAAPAGDFTERLEGARRLEVELLEELGGHPALRRTLRAASRQAFAATPA